MPYVNNHYVPIFYQMAFSLDGTGLYKFDLDNPNSPNTRVNLNRSGAKRKLYEKDTESLLTTFENEQAPIIKKIIEKKRLPTGKEREILLQFLTLQHIRIKGYKEDLKEKSEIYIDKSFLEFPPNLAEQSEEFKTEFKDGLVKKVFSHGIRSAKAYRWIGIKDLSISLLHNTTDQDFIYSDHPVVFKNLKFNNPQSDTKGLQRQGLTIFLPLNKEIMLFLYDRRLYYLRRRGNTFKIGDRLDIDQLNLLQLYNCYKYIYYTTKNSKGYIKQLFDNDKEKINETRGKLIIGSDGGQYRPDSIFIPKLSFVGKLIVRNRKIEKEMIKRAKDLRDQNG